MALTYSINGLGVIANCDSLTADTGSLGGAWLELGGGTRSLNPDTYLYGSSSIGSTYAAKDGFTYYDFPASPLDFATTLNGQYIYIWINISSAGTLAPLGTAGDGGLSIVIGDVTSDWSSWIIAGSDGSNGFAGGWKLFVIDPNSTPSNIGGTGADLTAVVNIGLWIDTDISVRADSIFIDQIAVGDGIRVTGTSTIGYEDLVNWCTDYPNRAWGMFQQREGIYYSYGNLYVGDSVNQTETTTFSDSGKVIQYGISEYWHPTLGAGSTPVWITSYPTTGDGIIIEEHASFDTTFSSTNNTIGGTSLSISQQAIYTQPLSINTTNATSFIDTGGAFKNLDNLTLISTDSITSKVFDLCKTFTIGASTFTHNTINTSDLITIDSTSTFTNNNINNSVGAISLTTASLAYLVNCTFTSNGSNHAVELTSIGGGSMSWDSVTSSYDSGAIGSPVTPTTTGNEDLYINVATGTIDVNVASGATIPSIRSAGAIVNVVAGLVTVTFTGIPDSVETRIRQGSYTIFHEQNAAGGSVSYQYTHNGDELVTVLFSGAGIISSKQLKITLGSSDQSIPMTFETDPSYIN